MRFAAVVPAAPALLAELTGGPVTELEPVRRATASALARLGEVLEDGGSPLVVLAPGNATRRLRADVVTGLDGFGVSLPAVRAATRPAAAGNTKPSAADARPATGPALALRLLSEAGIATSPDGILVYEVDVLEPTAGCLRLGAALAAEAGPHAVWLVLGDGSARRTPKAPGAFDREAEPFDEAAAKALDSADPTALVALEAERASRLMAAGRAPWQVLAGAVGPVGGPSPRAGVTCHEAPLGVGYLVATWDFAAPGTPGGPPGDA